MEPESNETPTPGASRAQRLLLVLLLVLATLVQFTVASRTVVHFPLRADAGDYFSYAHNLSQYGVYSATDTWRIGADHSEPRPDKLRSPGYPLFLLALGTPQPTKHYLRRVAFAQAVLGVVSVWLSYLIATTFLSRPLALVSAALVVLSPHITLSSVLVLSEALFTVLLLGSVYLSIRSFNGSGAGWRVAAGLMWAACALVRPTVLLFPLLLAAWAVALHGRGVVRALAPALLAFALVLAPWIGRSLVVTDTGPSLLLNSIAHGSYPGFMVDDRKSTLGFPYRFDPAYPAYARTPASLVANIGDKFSRDPVRMIRWYLLEKPFYLLSLKDLQAVDIQIYPLISTPYYERRSYASMRIATQALHWPLMFLGIVGASLALAGRRPRRGQSVGLARTAPAVVALLLVYFVALHMVTAPYPRYAIPFRPLIFALALLAIQTGWQAWRAKSNPRH